MAYMCFKNRGLECDGCSDCQGPEPDGYCDYCNEPLTNEEVADNDHKCPACGEEL